MNRTTFLTAACVIVLYAMSGVSVSASPPMLKAAKDAEYPAQDKQEANQQEVEWPKSYPDGKGQK